MHISMVRSMVFWYCLVFVGDGFFFSQDSLNDELGPSTSIMFSTISKTAEKSKDNLQKKGGINKRKRLVDSVINDYFRQPIDI